MEREELAGWLRLALTPDVGNSTARRLLAAFGLPSNVFGQSPAALEQLVHARQARALQAEPPELEALLQTTMNWLDESPSTVHRWILTLADADYPAALL